jgi:hypothetical protein
VVPPHPPPSHRQRRHLGQLVAPTPACYSQKIPAVGQPVDFHHFNQQQAREQEKQALNQHLWSVGKAICHLSL